jgi:hypothetical protein
MMQPGEPFLALEGLAGLSGQIALGQGRAGGGGSGFTWKTRFIPAHGGAWVETTLTTERELVFNPAMIVWLGALDELNDRQAHTWRQTILRAPTTNQQGLGGNDLPAGYLYDHEQRTETIFYVPPDSLRWAPHRFYELAVREVIEYRPTPRYGFGLVPIIPNPHFMFAPGEHRFRFWYRQAARAETPDVWTAQQALIEAVAPLLNVQPTLYTDAPGWDAMARGTLHDLHDAACWVTADDATGLRAYVQGSSAVGRDAAPGFELMTQLDVLLPLLHWRRHTGEATADALIERLLAAVRAFPLLEPAGYVPNHYPARDGDTFMDTWYFFENALVKLPWVAALTGDAHLKRTFFAALEGAKALVQHSHELLPLFADAGDGWAARSSLLNASVSGLYACGCILAAQLADDAAYLPAASTALRTLHRLPPHLLTHEPQQLSFAAAAANYLGLHTCARDFVNLSLRMGYWAADPAVPAYDPRGMFQACASLCYPAYKENVEVIWPWAELLRQQRETGTALPVELMAAFANLQRCHNYAFFDAFLPEALRRGPCPHVPYEDLATAEFAYTATLGKELYGAGEVFWSALLFERPALFTDVPPDVLTLALHVPTLDLSAALHQTLPQQRWLVYNPRPTPVAIRRAGTELLLESEACLVVEGR